MATTYQTTSRSATHAASNRLHRGEVSDFGQAMRLVIAQIEEELRSQKATCRRLGGDWTAEDDALAADFGRYADQARQALAIYRIHEAAMRRLVLGDLRANGLTDIAACYERDDYRGLAL